MKNDLIIAIDGPAGSGKSTTAKEVARRLNYIHLDSGAMYRTVTLNALNQGLDIYDADKVADIARHTVIGFEWIQDELNVFLGKENVTAAIRTPQVTNAVAPIAANPKVREILIEKQRQWALKGGIVAEGRDIGTKVFPQADLKIFMVAGLEERARRRYEEYQKKGMQVDMQEIQDDIRKRDEQDTQREANPLTKADDAIELDTSSMTIEEQVDFVVQQAHLLGAAA